MGQKDRGVKPEEGPLVASCSVCCRLVRAEEIQSWSHYQLFLWGVHGMCDDCQEMEDGAC